MPVCAVDLTPVVPETKLAARLGLFGSEHCAARGIRHAGSSTWLSGVVQGRTGLLVKSSSPKVSRKGVAEFWDLACASVSGAFRGPDWACISEASCSPCCPLETAVGVGEANGISTPGFGSEGVVVSVGESDCSGVTSSGPSLPHRTPKSEGNRVGTGDDGSALVPPGNPVGPFGAHSGSASIVSRELLGAPRFTPD